MASPPGRTRTRILLAIAAALTLGSAAAFYMYARPAVQAHEQRVLTGAFERVWLERGEFTIEPSGEVRRERPMVMPRRTVARYGLVPPGTYQALLLATDGDAAHAEQTELVLGARDAEGRWLPATAGAIAERAERTERTRGK